MNHCRFVTISSGREPFSQNLTGCVIGRGSPSMSPDSRQQLDDAPLRLLHREPGDLRRTRRGPRRRVRRAARAASRPSFSTMARTGRASSRHHVTSVVSPNVQIIAMPDPFSGSASSCATIGTRDVEQRRDGVGAEQRLVARVVGVGDERDARGEQLGAGGLDDRAARPRSVHRPGRSAAGGTRQGSRGRRARPARRRCACRRPTASATRSGRRGPARAGAGSRTATCAARVSPIVVYDCVQSTDRPASTRGRSTPLRAAR